METNGAGTPGGFRGAWRHRRWRWLLASFTVSLTGDFLYYVAIVVYVLDRTGSAAWVAGASMARLAAYVMLGPVGGAVANRLRRRRLMITLDLTRAALMVVLALLVWAGTAPAVVIAVTVAASALTTPYRPAAIAATPLLVAEDDLAAANAAESVVASVSLFAGPALGAAVVAAAGAGSAFLVNGLTFALSALLVTRVGDVGGGTVADDPAGGVVAMLRDLTADVGRGMGIVARNRTVAALTVFTCASLFQYGVEQVLHVFVATERLGLDPSGVGILSAAVGIGGVVMAPFAARVGASRDAGLLLGASGVAMGASLAGLSLTTSLPVAVGLLLVGGVGAVVFEVLFITMLQRDCPDEALAGVYGLLDSATAITQVAGSAVAPLLLSSIGLGPGLVAAGSVMMFAGAVTAPALLRATRASADERERLAPVVAQLRPLALFADSSQAALERVARAAVAQQVPAGTVIFEEGDTPDDLYVIDSGELEASASAGGLLNRMGPGDWFGEIGLLRGWPRTATVTAATPAELLRIPGRTFLDSLAGPDLLPDPVRRTMAVRLARTHPEAIDPALPA